MNTTIIKNGTLVTASDTFTGDILIKGEKISEIGIDLRHDLAKVIDANGKLVMPGGIDPHTHFDLPMFNTVSSDDHYTGHKAAAFGGTTTVLDFIPQDRVTLDENIETWKMKAEEKASIDYGFHMNITRLNSDIKVEIPKLREKGITTLKVFMAYNGRLRLQDGEIFEVMRIAKDYDMLVMLHAENGDVIDVLVQDAQREGKLSKEWHALTRPGWGGVEATLRGIALAAQADCPLYIVHMNQSGEVDQLRYAQEKSLQIIGETCPQYLFFSFEHLLRPDGSKWICSPPMRNTEDNRGLWDGLSNGVIQVIGTDHCPFFYDGNVLMRYEGNEISIPGKELGRDDFTKIPNGTPGVGDRLPVLWTYGVRAGKITPNQFVGLTSTNAAKIFGLYPKKGALLPGSDADIVIWDPQKEIKYGIKYAHHRTDYNLYEGWQLIGYPDTVFSRGEMIVDKNNWYGMAGRGKYLFRNASSFNL